MSVIDVPPTVVPRPDPGLEHGQGEPRRLGARVGVGVGDVAGERDRVAGIEGDRLVGDLDGDRALLDLHEFLGARRVGLAACWSPGPRVQSHSSTTSGGSVPATSTPRPPASPLHRTAPSPRRVTFTGLGSGGSTNAGSPTPSASLIRSSVPTLGFAAPCSTLTTIRRLTPAASAS